MMIIDAIREASTEQEVYFLLTCYVDAVRYCDKLCNLPGPMRDLPFTGMDDLKARVEALKFRFTENLLIINEALAIFGAALDRLYSLDLEIRAPLAKAA